MDEGFTPNPRHLTRARPLFPIYTKKGHLTRGRSSPCPFSLSAGHSRGTQAARSLGWWRIPSIHQLPILLGVTRGERLLGELKRKITAQLQFKIRSLILVKIQIILPSVSGPLGLK